MPYKLFKLVGDFKPWWNNNTQAYPAHHIEDFLTSDNLKRIPMVQNLAWEEIVVKKFEWALPMDTATLISRQLGAPQYLKYTDGTNNFYFYINGIVRTTAYKDGEFYYEYQYALDRYMSIYWFFLQVLINHNIDLVFNNMFMDRFIYTKDNDGNLLSAQLNFYLQKQFGNYAQTNEYQMVRELLYSTNATEIYNANYPDVAPAPVVFTGWFDPNKSISIPFETLATPNANNRYQYLVCKSSALQHITTDSNLDPSTYGDETKLIIPLYANLKYYMKGLYNIDITKAQTTLINGISSENFVGLFECDVPATLLYGLSKQPNSPVTCQYGSNIINGEATAYDIPFFRMPLNYCPRWKIIDYTKYDKGLDGKLKSIINNALYNVDENSEPMLLNPAYYTERYQLDTDKFISSDMSLIDYKIPNVKEILASGLSLYAYFNFDNELHIIYDYGINNNQANPIWNNNNSNLRNATSLANGIYGSAPADYYARNASTGYTSIQNRKSEEAQAWSDYGFNSARATLNAVPTGLACLNPISWFKKSAGVALDIAQGATDTKLSQERANRQLASTFKNITSSPSQTLSSPYINAGVPNKLLDNGALFATYAITLHDWDKREILVHYLNNGYPTKTVNAIANYDNRQYMNTINIDTTYNQDNIINTLQQNSPYFIFNQLPYIYEFLGWLNSTHRLYKTDYIVNCTDPWGVNYIANIENYLPPIPAGKININTIITNKQLANSDDSSTAIWNMLILNNNIPIDMTPLIFNWTIDSVRHVATLTVKNDNPTYYGTVIITYVGTTRTVRTKDTIYTIVDNDNDFINSLVPINTDNVYIISVKTTQGIVKINHINVLGVTFKNDWTCTAIPNNVLHAPNEDTSLTDEITIPTSVVTIGDNFMAVSSWEGDISKPFILPPKLTTIGNNFMDGWKLKAPFILPSTLKSIGKMFLNGAYTAQQINIPNSVTSIGAGSFSQLSNVTIINFNNLHATVIDTTPPDSDLTLTALTNKVISYTTGIKILGTYKAEFLQAYPNTDTFLIHRKLI